MYSIIPCIALSACLWEYGFWWSWKGITSWLADSFCKSLYQWKHSQVLNLSAFLLIKTFLAFLHFVYHKMFPFIWISSSQYHSNTILSIFLQTFCSTTYFHLTSQALFPSLKGGKKKGGAERRVNSTAHLSALLNHTGTGPQGIVWKEKTLSWLCQSYTESATTCPRAVCGKTRNIWKISALSRSEPSKLSPGHV